MLSRLGKSLNDPIRSEVTHAEKTDMGWIAHVNMIDVFVNLTTDLPASALQGWTDLLFRLGRMDVNGITESYGHKQPGDLVAVVDSEDYIEIAVVNSNAAQKLGAKVIDVLEGIYKD